jgi:hypothetical protein
VNFFEINPKNPPKTPEKKSLTVNVRGRYSKAHACGLLGINDDFSEFNLNFPEFISCFLANPNPSLDYFGKNSPVMGNGQIDSG